MRSTFLFFATCLACAVQAAETPTLKLTQTIVLPGVKGRFDHFAIDTKGQRFFVAALGNNTLEVVDLAAGKRLQSLPGMSKPTGVLYLPEPNQIVVANGDDGTVKILDGSTYKVLHNLAGLEDADNLRFDLKTKLAWLGYGDGALGIIDVASARQIASVKLPKHPESFQLEKEGNRLFVNVPDAKQVTVIDRDRRAVIANWPMARAASSS
jgi:DNA-binding beta-propeller fold protein YncE